MPQAITTYVYGASSIRHLTPIGPLALSAMGLTPIGPLTLLAMGPSLTRCFSWFVIGDQHPLHFGSNSAQPLEGPSLSPQSQSLELNRRHYESALETVTWLIARDAPQLGHVAVRMEF